MIPAQEKLLRTAAAAEILGYSPRTLAALRLRGGGPAYVRLGKRAIRYQIEDLRAYIQAGATKLTSEEAALR